MAPNNFCKRPTASHATSSKATTTPVRIDSPAPPLSLSSLQMSESISTIAPLLMMNSCSLIIFKTSANCLSAGDLMMQNVLEREPHVNTFVEKCEWIRNAVILLFTTFGQQFSCRLIGIVDQSYLPTENIHFGARIKVGLIHIGQSRSFQKCLLRALIKLRNEILNYGTSVGQPLRYIRFQCLCRPDSSSEWMHAVYSPRTDTIPL